MPSITLVLYYHTLVKGRVSLHTFLWFSSFLATNSGPEPLLMCVKCLPEQGMNDTSGLLPFEMDKPLILEVKLPLQWLSR